MKIIHKILIIIILHLICIPQLIYAQDTIVVTKPVVKAVNVQDTAAIGSPVTHKFKPETLKATMMAVVFPGLGQIYNRKIWKIPVVYVGFGALIYSATFNSRNYILYMKAYQDFTDKILETNSYLNVISPAVDPKTYDPMLHAKEYSPSVNSYYKDAMLRMVDYYKRYRDLSYIGIGAWYLISILDANVDASLFNYDVTPNLDITVFPVQVPLPGGFTGAGINFGMRITF